MQKTSIVPGAGVKINNINIKRKENNGTYVFLMASRLLKEKGTSEFLDAANFFKSDEKEESIKEFCQSEYKKDWYAAYMTFKQEGRFPNFIRRTL